MERRKLLTLMGGTVTAGLAGCLGGDGDDDGGGDNGGDDGNGDDNGSQNPANFAVEITSATDSVEIGGSMTVEWEVENTGGQEGTQTVVFSVGGSEQGSEEVTVGGGETSSGEFSYTATESDAGEITATVETDDDSAEASVTVPEPANFSVSITAISPIQIGAGSQATVPWEVENTGDLEGTQTVVFSVGGSEEGSEEVTLGGGETASGEFTYASGEDQAGQELDATVATDNSEASTTILPTGNLPDLTASAQQLGLGLDAEPEEYPDKDLTELDPSGPLVEATGNINDDGTWESTNVSVPDLIDLLTESDLGGVLSDFLEGIDVEEDIINEFEFEALKTALIDFLDSLQATEEQAAAISDFVGSLNLDIGLPIPLGDLIEEILLSPEEQVNSLLDLLGVGNMEALVNTIIGFIDEVEEGDYAGLKQFLIETVEGLNLGEILSGFSIDVEPEPIQGVFDPDAEGTDLLMTFPLTTVTLVPSIGDSDAEPPEVDLDLGIELTTATSGNLTGSVDLDTEGDSATATVVNNEFTLDLEQFDLGGLVGGLDFRSLFETLYEVLEVDPQEQGIDLEELVPAMDIPSLVENGELVQFVLFFIDDESGRHAVQAALDMSFKDLDAALGNA